MSELWQSQQLSGMDLIIDKMKEINPKVYNACWPRQILPPHGYLNPRYWGAIMMAHILGNVNKGFKNKADASCQLASWRLIDYDVPTYFIARDYIKAVVATDPPDCQVSDLKWPLDAMLLVLPVEFMVQYTGQLIPFLIVTKAPVGKFIPSPEKLGITLPNLVANEHDRAIFTWSVLSRPLNKESGTKMGMLLPVDYSSTYPLTYTMMEIIKNRSFMYDNPSPEMLTLLEVEHLTHEQDIELNEKMNALALKLLIAMTARPHLVETGKCVRPARIKKGNNKPALWGPSIIGAKYVLNRNGEQGGSHTSPVLHRRLGHFTHQPIGKRDDNFIPVKNLPRTPEGHIDWNNTEPSVKEAFWKTHKLIWIDPVWVGMNV